MLEFENTVDMWHTGLRSATEDAKKPALSDTAVIKAKQRSVGIRTERHAHHASLCMSRTLALGLVFGGDGERGECTYCTCART